MIKIISTGNIILADPTWAEQNYPGDWEELASPPVPTTPVDPTQWLIDLGPFFDRFKGPTGTSTAKMALLTSTNNTIQAIVKDLQIRKWVDLKNPEVAAGIDAAIALAIPGVDAALKTYVLDTPVSHDENMALKKLYFNG